MSWPQSLNVLRRQPHRQSYRERQRPKLQVVKCRVIHPLPCLPQLLAVKYQVKQNVKVWTTVNGWKKTRPLLRVSFVKQGGTGMTVTMLR